MSTDQPLSSSCSKRNFYFIFIIGLLSGSLTSITLKMTYGTKSNGVDGKVREFDKPWFMSWVMFVAMMGALPIWKIKTWNRPECKLPPKLFAIVSIPAFLDMLGRFLRKTTHSSFFQFPTTNWSCTCSCVDLSNVKRIDINIFSNILGKCGWA
jgi:hypothetical protein